MCVWLVFLMEKFDREPWPLPGLCCASLGSLDRGENGLMKVGDAGVSGLMGALSGKCGRMSCWIQRAHS
jgi:hypothetical protein